MTSLLLVDDSSYSAEMFVEIIRDRLDWSVTVATRAGDVTGDFLAGTAFDLAVVDLSFPQESLTGLDVLVTIHRHAPGVALVILTQGDAVSGDVLRDAWEALPLAGIISKITPVNRQIELLSSIVREGQIPPDPVLRAWLPAERSPWRRADQYHRLVKHAGHAKLWRGLIDASREPSYTDLSHATGLKLNTLKNYRADIVGDLALHGLDDPTIKQMYQFAKRTRPLLEPFIEQSLPTRDRA